MRSSLALLTLAGSAMAMPPAPRAVAPLMDTPTPSPSQLAGINQRADGTLPNEGAPPSLSDATVPLIQAIALVEEFEVALFSSILQNVTNGVPGFTQFPLLSKSAIINILDNIVAVSETPISPPSPPTNTLGTRKKQEHRLILNSKRSSIPSMLATSLELSKLAPLPCQYTFPSKTFMEALDVAAIWTDVGLGALQDVLESVGSNGDDVLLRGLTSVVGEGEQEGFYRLLLEPQPGREAVSHLRSGAVCLLLYVVNTFIVPGSCPFDISDINLPLFGALTVQNGFNVQPQDQTLTFTADLTDVPGADKFVGGDGSVAFL